MNNDIEICAFVKDWQTLTSIRPNEKYTDTPITMAFTCYPSPDLAYRLWMINNEAMEHKWIKEPANFTLPEKAHFGWKIKVYCSSDDRPFWMGVCRGREVGKIAAVLNEREEVDHE